MTARTIILYVVIVAIIAIVLYVIWKLSTSSSKSSIPPILRIQKPTPDKNTYKTTTNTELWNSPSELSRVMTKEKIERQIQLETDVNNSLEALEADFLVNTKWDSLIAMSNIYAKGVYPIYIPNKNIAIKLLKYVQKYCPYEELSRIADLKLVEAENFSIDETEIVGKQLPNQPANNIFGYFQEQEEKRKQKLNSHPHLTIQEPVRNIPFQEPVPVQKPIINIPKDVWKYDGQNVHDSSVVQAFRNTTRKLLDKYPKPNVNKTEIRNYIIENKELNTEDKNNAIYALDWLTDDKIVGLENISQNQALGLVWTVINSKPNKENMKFTLAKQLSSIVENKNMVCSMGKAERILQTLDGTDNPDVATAKPIFVVREEISSKAAKIRNDNDGSADADAKKKFRDEITREYITNMHMSPKIIEPIIKEMEEGF
jgi:hypothetical protein